MRVPHRPLTVTIALTLAAGLGAGLLAGCSDSSDDAGPPPEVSAPPGTASSGPGAATSGPATVGTKPSVAGIIAQNLAVPWGLVFLPGGEALVAERDSARIKRISGGKVSVVGTIDGVDPGGEGGLLGLAVARTFATDHLLYVYYTAGDDNRIVRMTYTGGKLGPARTVLTGIPKGGRHNGGRMIFGPDGMLYVGTGEAGDEPLAQQRDSLGGKILRITPAGKPAPGNPFGGSPVYSYGHRNPQGLAFDSAGRLWSCEFGDQTWDELNLIKPGRNYGWPIVEGKEGRAGYVDPLAQWSTDDASPSGLAIVGNMAYMAGLRGARLWQIPLNGESVGTPRAYFTGEYGRLRTVEFGPDRTLWLTTSNRDGRGNERDNDDKILRVALR